MQNQKQTEVCMQTSDNYIVGENEYLKDDMIYCKNCGEPKLYKFEDWEEHKDKAFLKVPRRVRVICSCKQVELMKEKELKEKMELLNKYTRLRELSLIEKNLGERYFNASFETMDMNVDESIIKAHTRCKKFCENYQECLKNGYGIYLFGNCGNGKTYLMACIVNELTKKYVPCVITNFLEISKEIRKTYNGNTKDCESDLIKQLVDIPLLLLDDIGTERLQINGEDTFIQEKIYDIVNSRYIHKKSTIFSGNLSFSELIEQKGMWQKTVDRIVEMSSAIIEVKGESYRIKNRKKDLPF